MFNSIQQDFVELENRIVVITNSCLGPETMLDLVTD